jgi:5-methylcytosine-specific restriction endonuclease McrA
MICSRCKLDKPDTEFYARGDRDAPRSHCKACHSEKRKEYYQKNKERELAINRNWEKANREARQKIFRKWTNKAKYYHNKRRTDIKYKIKKDVSNAVNRAIKDKQGTSVFKILGYTRMELIAHLQSTMPIGCSWEDYLKGKLHIDHIIPVSHFNYQSHTDDDFKKCWALSNLQLLTAEENLKKGDKIIPNGNNGAN